LRWLAGHDGVLVHPSLAVKTYPPSPWLRTTP
jgi:hypothetical protein